MLALFDEGTQVAGAFTRSLCASAPVEWCRNHIKNGRARALLVNSGNANAFTGQSGVQQVQASAEITSNATAIRTNEVFLASTGVIGEALDATKFSKVINELANSVHSSGMLDAAKAIMTTDTYPKVATLQTTIDDIPITINGIAKGAGMIAPDMATMLAFVFTDAALSASVLQSLVTPSVEKSFNAITVDSDTSTSDTVLVFATGDRSQHGAPKITSTSDPRLDQFREALDRIMLDLAHQIVRDGEGCRKFIEISVSGASDDLAAKKIALSIANSPLVKTAIAGEDANWGRIVMAIGKAGQAADRDKIEIWFGDILVAKNGMRNPDYVEENAARYMRAEKIDIRVDVGIGAGRNTVWTCDLTKEYIAINGDYRS